MTRLRRNGLGKATGNGLGNERVKTTARGLGLLLRGKNRRKDGSDELCANVDGLLIGSAGSMSKIRMVAK